MGMDPADAWQEEAYDRMVEEVRDVVIDEFVSDRMESYYRANPGLSDRAAECLNEARRLKDVSATACLVFSQAAVEVALRDAILKPLVFGMVHDAKTAALIADLVEENRVIQKLLNRVLAHHGRDLTTERRKGSSKTRWEELASIKRLRNHAVHGGEMVSDPDAQLSLMTAEFIVEELYPHIRKQITGK